MKWFSFGNSARKETPAADASSSRAAGAGKGGAEARAEAALHPVRQVVVVAPAAGSDPLSAHWESLRERWSFRVAATGREALEQILRDDIAAVVAPEQAVDLTGARLLGEVRKLRPGLVRVWRGPLSRVSSAAEPGGMPPFVVAEPASVEDLAAGLERALAIEGWLGGERGRSLLVRMENLPAMPSLYGEVMAELRSDDPSIESVANVIARDPALTAKMLQTVNSPIFALRRPVGTAYEAVTFLGAERTKALILMASLSLHGSLTRCEGFSQENFWQHSLSVATWARVLALAEMKDASVADQAFTAGILHDVGRLLFASNLAPEYGRVLTEASARGISVHQAEREMLGLDHGCLGAGLLGTWGLPLDLLEAVAWHDDPGASSDQSYSLLTAVHVANALEYERKGAETGAPALGVPGVAAVAQLDWTYLSRLGIDALVDRWRQLIGCRPQPRRP